MQAALLMFLGGVVCGCAQTPFGGRLDSVTLDANLANSPGSHPAYLVTNQRYLADPGILNDDDAMKKHFKGMTPVQVRISPYLWVYVVRLPDGKLSAPVMFNPDDYPNGTIMARMEDGTNR
jgi:hypothetical protein